MCYAVFVLSLLILDLLMSVLQLVVAPVVWIVWAADALVDLPDTDLFRKATRLWQSGCIFAISCVELIPWSRLTASLTAACQACWARVKQRAILMIHTTEGALPAHSSHWRVPFKSLSDMQII